MGRFYLCRILLKILLMENPILEKIKDFADAAHGEQQRKYSKEPYINHPVRVMATCTKYTEDIAVLSAALLHDVLEDTQTGTEEMLRFLKEVMTENEALKTVALVVELTDVYVKKDYPHLNRGKRKGLETSRLSQVSGEAQTIKYADLIDNSINIAEHDPDFAKVFLYEGKKLVEKMDAGHPDLRTKAAKTIEDSLNQISY